jgi:hypothetical protein
MWRSAEPEHRGGKMVPIVDISWHEFKSEQSENPSVGDLYNLANQYSPELFIFHETSARWSAVVIPELVVKTVDDLQFDHGSPASAVGLTDLIRREQLTVNRNQPASIVAQLAWLQEISQVIVVDENLKPIGLFIPSNVFERLLDTLSGNLIDSLRTGLETNLNQGLAQGGLVNALKEIEKVKQSYHSERLNYQDPDPLVCQAKGRIHSTSFCPCQRPGHSGGPCSKRKIARK